MSYYLKHWQNNIWHGKVSLFPEESVIHAVSTRQGGTGRKPYDTLNLALHVGDDDDTVRKNRRLFAHSLGLNPKDIVTPEQVHGVAVRRVTGAERGRGSMSYADAVPATDALITDEPNLPLMLCFADCTPLLFFDPEHLAVGVAHAGWKGTVGKIGAATLAAMNREFGTRPQDVLAAIGPAIGACCYEVGDNVIEAAETAFAQDVDKVLLRRGGQTHFDLQEANRLTLLAAGVVESNLETADTCTSCENQWYFSYRAAGGQTGRIAALMALRGV